MFNPRSLNCLPGLKVIVILLTGLVLNSCYVYYPQTGDIPLIKQKKELRVDGGISLLPAVNGTISYGLTDTIAIQTSLHYINTVDSWGYLINGAIGLYKYNPKNNWSKEIYVGFGNGYADTFYESYHSGRLKGNYQLYFVQGNIGRRGLKLKFIECAFGLKLGLLNSHFRIEDVYGVHPNENKLSALIEPIISIKLGGERLMVNIKPSLCSLKKISGNGEDLPYFPLAIGLSLNYRF
ncbi:MAG: hypothetical protein PHT07_04745 [Paludibacter sp.]|nr:hypothetical protein [Paludibacter sp.]